MREGWTSKTLDEVTFPSGTIDPRKEPEAIFQYVDVSSVSNQTFEIIEASALLGKDAPSRARRLIRSDDIVFATIRPTLQRIAVVPKELDRQVCSTGYFVFRAKPELDNRFLFHYLFTNEFSGAMGALQSGASYPAVNDAQVRQQRISFPPIPEQKQIVAILDKAFEGIATATANAEKNLKNARELFESYLNAVFTQKGEGWVEKRLGEICSIKHGFAFKSLFFRANGNLVLLTPGSFFEAGGYREQGKKTKYYEGEIPDGYVLKKGDLLFAMTEQAAGLLGSSLIVPESNRFLHNQRLGLVQVHTGFEWVNDFFFHHFNTKRFRDAVQESASGVKVRHTSPKKLGAITVTFPPTEADQMVIADTLNTLSAETKQLESLYQKKLTALAELKQSLLQKAFSGELTANPEQVIKEEALA